MPCLSRLTVRQLAQNSAAWSMHAATYPISLAMDFLDLREGGKFTSSTNLNASRHETSTKKHIPQLQS